MSTLLPEGFAPHFRKSPVTDPWEPLYSRRIDGRVEIGLVLAAGHCNSRGFVHGGVIAALADNAMGLSFHEARAHDAGEAEAKGGAVTVSLSIDFLSTAKIDDWLLIAPRVLKFKGSTGFVDALVTAGDHIVARASAVFRIVG